MPYDHYRDLNFDERGAIGGAVLKHRDAINAELEPYGIKIDHVVVEAIGVPEVDQTDPHVD